MKCGALGHLTVNGQPCGQEIGAAAKGCIWHTRDAEGRRLLALKGGIASRLRSALPASTPEPPFDSPESIIGWAQQMAHVALTAEDFDPRRHAEARGYAQLALTAHSGRSQQQLVDALLRVEHGGAAFALLARLQDGLAEGKRRPLPPRVLSAVVTAPSEAES